MGIIIDHEYHVVELYGTVPEQVLDWCRSTFGEHGDRWFVMHRTKIYFANARDHMMFLLRYS